MSDDTTSDRASSGSARRLALNPKLRWACHSIRLAALVLILFKSATTLWDLGDRDAFLALMNELYGLDSAGVSDLRYWSAVTLWMLEFVLPAIVVARLWRLTGIYLDGRVFSIEAAATLRLVALWGFAATIAGLVTLPLGAALLWAEQIVKVPLQIWLAPINIFCVLCCIFALALSVILETAAKIAREHARFV
ncbi:hypothetical protein [Methylosinus sp. Sm6]|uniref:hypothetical protein n=1 Tax=Methylosinus sp. Sm6 TaxID=2866948 RepID=UPI001C98F66C|nr:hypothetical protein [Methylosinus sp. Sm6]MBY6240898.1 hypothetical protein [Methylosinus sp. Sm6]